MRSTPVFTVLSKQPLLFGGEFKLVAANLGIGGAATFMLGIVLWPILTLILHIVLVQMAKRDAHARQIYIAYARQADRYEPWVDPSTRWSDRPRRLVTDELL